MGNIWDLDKFEDSVALIDENGGRISYGMLESSSE